MPVYFPIIRFSIMNKTIKLLEFLLYDRNIELDDIMLKTASKNKVLLHVLRKADIRNHLRRRQESQYQKILNEIQRVWEIIGSYHVVLIKFLKPVVYVPSDIDFLVSREDIERVIPLLLRKGYSISVVEPYCITLTKKGIVIDLYIYPSVFDVIYLDSKVLFNNTMYIDIGDTKVRVLDKKAEVLITIAHAVYKEGIMTLNDYITIMKWYTRDILHLAKRAKITTALAITLNYMKKVSKGEIELPVKFNLNDMVKAYIDKIVSDELTRASIINILNKIKDPRLGRLLFMRLIRETY